MNKTQIWRHITKQRMIDSLGGRCTNCNYSNCKAALEFHHIDPNEKEFSLAAAMVSPKAWDRLVIELRKCVLLCANCHREVHAGLIKVENKQYFNEEYAEYKVQIEMNKCPICSKLKPITNKTCSKVCAGKLHRKVDWSAIDLQKLLIEYKNPEQIGKLLDVSGAAVRKQLKKQLLNNNQL